MASQVDWTPILDARYASYTVEVQAFVDTVHISSSVDISIENIYEAIKSHAKVPDNLKLLYHEAAYGSNKDVKIRMRNRVSNFKRKLK